MQIYGIPGDNKEIRCYPYLASKEMVKMFTPRPTRDHICLENGQWQVDYKEKAKVTRSEAISYDIKVNGNYWQVDPESVGFMEKAVSTYDFLFQMEQAKPIEHRQSIPSSVTWILSDNTIHVTNYMELRTVLVYHSLRIEEIFRQYNIWLAGGKHDTEFIFVDPNGS